MFQAFTGARSPSEANVLWSKH